MATWEKHTFKPRTNHNWKSRKGYNVFVADRGAVRLEFPARWIVKPADDCIKFHDREPPDDDCVLAVSYLLLSTEIDWSGLPVHEMVEAATSEDERPVYAKGKITSFKRGKIEFAWREMKFVDPVENREALSRLCIARQPPIQALITFDFWETDAFRFGRVWDDVLDSLVLDEMIKDPTKGPGS